MLVIGSRGSQLALWQAHYVQRRLEARGWECRVEIIQTTGDRITHVPLAQAGTQAGMKGLFTKEIEEALIEERIDVAVHSLKDLPTELPKGLTIAATPEREYPNDAMVGRPLRKLPPGSRVGTSSLRRTAQLKRYRPDLKVESIRGNLDTRLRKLDEGLFDAIVLAAAGLRRLGWSDRIAEVLAPEVMCPAVGQGTLAIETRIQGVAYEACAILDHPWTRFSITAERAVLAALGGGCQIPMGAFATISGSDMQVTGVVVAPDGSRLIREQVEGDCTHPTALGTEVGQRLIARGALEMMEAAPGADVIGLRDHEV
jgi:hydroxymethylbilane synthase